MTEKTEFREALENLLEASRDIERIKSGECRKLHVALLKMENNKQDYPDFHQGNYETVVNDYAMRVSMLVRDGKITYEEATGGN